MVKAVLTCWYQPGYQQWLTFGTGQPLGSMHVEHCLSYVMLRPATCSGVVAALWHCYNALRVPRDGLGHKMYRVAAHTSTKLVPQPAAPDQQGRLQQHIQSSDSQPSQATCL